MKILLLGHIFGGNVVVVFDIDGVDDIDDALDVVDDDVVVGVPVGELDV